MNHIASMIGTHPRAGTIDADALAACIAACFDCAQSCTACADACLAEDSVVELRACIRTNLDCADVCLATGRVLSRLTDADPSRLRGLVELCRQACAACAEECEKHAHHHEHCRVCAEECRRCEQACAALLDALGH